MEFNGSFCARNKLKKTKVDGSSTIVHIVKKELKLGSSKPKVCQEMFHNDGLDL